MNRSPITRRKIGKLLRLPAADRLLLLRAAVWLPAVDLGLRAFGFARLRRVLARGAAPRPAGPPDPARWAEVERVAWCVAAAARHHLYPTRCLTRSLVLWRLLARRGIPSELQIGVRKEERELLAHAWVECAGRPVAETGDVERRYASMAVPAP